MGILIILGALYVEGNTPTEATGTVVVAQAPERTYIESMDSNGNGIRDWEENLGANAYDTISTPSSTVKSGPDEEYTPPTTLTGKFSEAFFKDYMEGKMRGQDFSDPSAFVGTAVDAIKANTQSKRHSRLELTIIPSTPESIHEYGNRVAFVILSHINDNSDQQEAVILKNALEKNDQKILDTLKPFHEFYSNTIQELLNIEVPDSLALEHINLLNAFETVLTNNEAMQVAFSDPLFALARIQTYEKDVANLFNTLTQTAQTLSNRGVVYGSNEAGKFFYLFDI